MRISILLLFVFLFALCVYLSINPTKHNYSLYYLNDLLNVNHNSMFSYISHTHLILSNMTSNINNQYSHISNYNVSNTPFTQSNVSLNTVVNSNIKNHSYQSFSNSQSNNNIQQSNQPSHLSLPQSNVHIQQFTISPNHQLFKSNLTYNVVLRTKNINDSTIKYSLLQSNYYIKDESYLVSYIDYEQHPLIESNPCESFSFPYCILQNYDDSDHLPFAYSIFYQSDYVVYIDIDQLDIPMNNIDSTLLDNVLYGLSKDQFDVFTCTTYSDRILNGCIITKQSLIKKLLTSTTMSKGGIEVLDYIPLLFKEMNKRLRVRSLYIKSELSPYLNIKDKLIPSLFGCKDLTENDTSFTVSVTSYRRPKLYQVFEGFDKQDLQPKQVIMIQNSNILHWNVSLFANRKTKYYHIWCSNWNSKYFGKYIPAILFDTTFSFIFDDDVFLASSQGFSNTLKKIRNNISIYGSSCYRYHYLNDTKYKDSICDHVGFLMYLRIKHLKILFQYKLLTYSHGEDIILCMLNYIKCNINSFAFSIPYKTSTRDEYKSKYSFILKAMNSYHNVSYPNRIEEMKFHGVKGIYKYYINHGYVPVWKRLIH